jgi:four helix bundle protein
MSATRWSDAGNGTGRFDRLEVYRLALGYAGSVYPVVQDLRRAEPALADQLMRAVCSIPLNIAEGAGEFSKGDKARFYRYALRSTTETIGVLDLCRELRIIEDEEHLACRDTAIRLTSMMTRLVLAMKRPNSPGGQPAGEM